MSRSTVEVPQRSSSSYVLDSFALLAWLQDEAGADTVQMLLEKAKHQRIQIYVSWMNIAEVYYPDKLPPEQIYVTFNWFEDLKQRVPVK